MSRLKRFVPADPLSLVTPGTLQKLFEKPPVQTSEVAGSTNEANPTVTSQS